MSRGATLRRRSFALTAALAVHAVVLGVWLWEPRPPALVGHAVNRGNGLMIALGEIPAKDITPATSEPASAESPAAVTAPASPATPVREPEAAPPQVTALPPGPAEVPTAATPEGDPPPVVAPSQPAGVTMLPRRRPPNAAPVPPPPRTAASAPAAAASDTAAVTTSRPGSTGPETTDGGASRGTGTEDAAAAAARSEYFRELGAWFDRHKRYPRQARLRRQEGSVLLALTLARDGRVIDYAIREPSGHRALDEAVLDMIEHAPRLPAFPDALRQEELQVLVPIRFRLRG